MTPEQLDAIQARADAATEGPWRWDEKFHSAEDSSTDTGLALTNDAGAEVVGAYNYHCCPFRDDPHVEDNDAEFIAHARTDVPALLAYARDLEARIDKARDYAEIALTCEEGCTDLATEVLYTLTATEAP